MKKIISLIIILALVFSLAACDKKDDNKDTATTTPEATTSTPEPTEET